VADRATTDMELLKDLTNRVMGFSNIHELLSKQGMSWIDFRKLIHTCVDPFLPEQGQSLELSGPNISVNPTATVKLVMVFNELATNASKHGALKYKNGRIRVSWRRSNGQLELNWEEHHDGEVSRNLEGGFGTMVLRSSIPYEFDGIATLERADDGILFKASIPLDKIVPS
jgi:two-component sensor histidine kinase